MALVLKPAARKGDRRIEARVARRDVAPHDLLSSLHAEPANDKVFAGLQIERFDRGIGRSDGRGPRGLRRKGVARPLWTLSALRARGPLRAARSPLAAKLLLRP